MSRYIDADAYAAEMKTRQDACKEMLDAAEEDGNDEVYDRMNCAFGIFVEAKLTLDAMPTIDAVPVRCKDCKYDGRCMFQSFVIDNSRDEVPYDKNTFYCADGERKDDEEC